MAQIEKIMSIYYGNNRLPYKDEDRQINYPVVGSNLFIGENNVTKLRFYVDEIGGNQFTWVAVLKLPDGSEAYKPLDEMSEDGYVDLDISSIYTSQVGAVFISLGGYTTDDTLITQEDGVWYVHGNPTVLTTGVVKIMVNYAPIVLGMGGDLTYNQYQLILALLSTKIGYPTQVVRVDELPEHGADNYIYVVQENDTLHNVYIWNGKTEEYVFIGSNEIDLGAYYTRQQGETFEEEINSRVTSVENELSSVASVTPKGVYDTLSDLETAYPNGEEGIFVVDADGHWYFWNGNAWTDGGIYLATGTVSQTTKIAELNLTKDIPSYGLEKNIFNNNGQSLFENFEITKTNNLDDSFDTSNKVIGYIGQETDTGYCRAIFRVVRGKTYYFDASLGGFGYSNGRKYYYCYSDGTYAEADYREAENAGLLNENVVKIEVPEDCSFEYVIISWGASNWKNYPGENKTKGFFEGSFTSPYQNKYCVANYKGKIKVEIEETSFVEGKINYLDATKDGYVANSIINADGTISANSGYTVSNYIKVKAGDVIKWQYFQNLMGGFYNSEKQFIAPITGSTTNYTDETSHRSIAIRSNEICYVRLNLYYLAPRIIVKNQEFDANIENYIPRLYGIHISKEDEDKINAKIISYSVIRPTNLLNQNDTDVVNGKYYSANGTEVEGAGWNLSGYIEVDDTKSYMITVCTNHYGTSNVNVQLFNANKERIGSYQGSSSGVTLVSFESDDFGTYPVMITGILNRSYSNVKYIRISFATTGNSYMPHSNGETRYQVVEGSSIENFPSTYQPYFAPYKVLDNNVGLNERQKEEVEEIAGKQDLAGKVAIFDGDSICNATSASAYDGGWARRVGNANGMNWQNKGWGGGTIARLSGHDAGRHIISEQWQNYPEQLDYIILEGGTNDADIISSDSSLSVGTFSPTDWSGNYDNSTFCGAMEYMLYNIINKYPHARIGYIVAPKMGAGVTNWGEGNARYDIFTKAIAICKKWGVPVINLWDDCPLNPILNSQYASGENETYQKENHKMYTDGQHLTEYGYDRIWKMINAFVKSL